MENKKIKQDKNLSNVSEEKKKAVKKLSEEILKSKTVMVASIKSLPSSQFQKIRKNLRGKAKVSVAKKKMTIRAIDECKKGTLMNLKPYITENSALLFSDLDAFELSAILSENKAPMKAKIGQISDKDIEIEAGPTDLVPGPVITELGSLGLKIAVEDGKIAIKENKIIVKNGEAVNEAASSLMNKFNMTPFFIRLEPIAAYDALAEKIYKDLKIDKEETLKKLKQEYTQALAFAVSVAYPCKETISRLIQKAALQEKALSTLVKADVKQPTIEEAKKPTEQNQITENTQPKSEEAK
ncbi:50S ribosomal protein L10 [Candidatus Woesearchaeota archaeon CG10_big_fil_rev_8_21_14_0_10_34_12]|nr:MAG: 50S ribosomal protein L10 [Candidatus Woesearchaeota archaeon CG10_big_fil_rev_8_21_14_0_10_34_12]